MSSNVVKEPCFQHGCVVLSPAVVEYVRQEKFNPMVYFLRHLHGDWGHVNLFSATAFQLGLYLKGRLFSRFFFDREQELWIVTSRDRSVTTLLFPHEKQAFASELNR